MANKSGDQIFSGFRRCVFWIRPDAVIQQLDKGAVPRGLDNKLPGPSHSRSSDTVKAALDQRRH